MRLFSLLMAVLLAGCATCDHHPVACLIGGAVVVGSVAATIQAHNDRDPQHSVQINPVARPVRP
jgi:hypothetical protein